MSEDAIFNFGFYDLKKSNQIKLTAEGDAGGIMLGIFIHECIWSIIEWALER